MKTHWFMVGAIVALVVWIVPSYGDQIPGGVIAIGSMQERQAWILRPHRSTRHGNVPGRPGGIRICRAIRKLNFDRTPFEGPAPANSAPRRNTGAAGVGPAALFSQDWAHSRLSPVRSSVVVDPPNGRVPVRPEAEARRDYDLARITDSWEYQSPWERCITRGVPGGMFPSDYNNAVRIFQTPDSVIIFQEMIHETRSIPVDGRPHIPSNVPQWMGDSRGHWKATAG